MAKILILYSTTDGHTWKICRQIQTVLQNKDNQVAVHAIYSIDEHELSGYDKIVVGASIRYGKHHKNVYHFAAKHQQTLANTFSAFFSVNIKARKPNRNTPKTNPYVKKFLSKISWQPNLVDVFAGKIDYKKYRPMDKMLTRIIMYFTGGPTATNTAVEFTDWNKVDEFAKRINDAE